MLRGLNLFTSLHIHQYLVWFNVCAYTTCQREVLSQLHLEVYRLNVISVHSLKKFECQADFLTGLPEVVLVERDTGITTHTTRTPAYLGLPSGAWKEEGGVANAGEGILIGIVDTGIDPTHPSFSDKASKPYPNATKYRGSCEVAEEFPEGSCNKKLVGAQHFAAAAIAQGVFNASIDFASPLDADGHGT